jgi:hypothetical protein
MQHLNAIKILLAGLAGRVSGEGLRVEIALIGLVVAAVLAVRAFG